MFLHKWVDCMGEIFKVSGPVITAEQMSGSQINELVKVGEKELLGEIIALYRDQATIQVYEDTSGLRPGEKVVGTGAPLSVELGPGLISSVFDGIQRPLEIIRQKSGDFIARGLLIPALDHEKKWEFKPKVKKGEEVIPGDVLGEVQEFSIVHKIMVPIGVSGKITDIKEGSYTIDETIAKVNDAPVKMVQYWPVRKPRPFKEKKHLELPLITGMRIVDTFFPIAKGGTAAIPGPFGSGKTVTQTSLAKQCDAQVIVYVGCGERGNEMTEVLTEFPRLVDPKTQKPLMERTILVANTSNMPVAAREASIYTGITLAEYYRDQGYDVAVMADSTSRWAEAMREISGRMEEMPGEEGYPAYLGKKLAEFYERSGRVYCLGSKERSGSVSVIGAVSPPGGDLSEPVSQSTLRVTKVFWALDSSLARRRHFPAINWLKSYSLYEHELRDWYAQNVGEDFWDLRGKSMELLQKESELQNIVQLIGPDALPEKERLVLVVTKMLREDFLQQFAFDKIDGYSTLSKQYAMLKLILRFYAKSQKALELDMPLEKILEAPQIREIAGLKGIEDARFDAVAKELEKSIDKTFGK